MSNSLWLHELHAEHQASLSFTIFLSLFKLMYGVAEMPFNHHLTLCHPLLLLTSIFPTYQGLFQWISSCIRGPKYWSFSFSISPSNNYSGLISFMTDWFDLLAVQGILKILLQHHSLKASILWHAAFFVPQLSHRYMTPGKTTALTIWTTVSKVISLLFNMLFSFVIAFLPRSEHLLILWLQSPSTVIWEPHKIKTVIVSTFPPFFICHEVIFYLGIKNNCWWWLQPWN